MQVTIPTNEEIRAAVRDELTAFFVLNHFQSQPEQDEIGGVKEAALWVNKAPATIYDLVSKRLIPHSKRGKQLYFSKKELLAWISSGKRRTSAEITAAIN